MSTAAATLDTARPDTTTARAEDAEAFADRLVDTLNAGASCLMISIGHRCGLFDTLATISPASSDELAARSGLDERYVREWLGAMTTARIVTHDPDRAHYALPRAHADSLTRAAGADNMAVFAQYIGQLGAVEDEVLDCFRHGGGVPYTSFRRFHEIMMEDSGQSVLPALLDQILPLVPGLTARLESGIRVLDAGCGRGRALLLMAARFPHSRFVGYDLSSDAIEYARDTARRAGLNNVKFVERDLGSFDTDAEPEAFDLVTTFDAVHDQPFPLRLLRGIRRTLRAGGVYLMQDIDASTHHHGNLDHPLGPLLYTISCMHCMTVSLAQGGEGLGAMWGRERALELLQEAGFGDTALHRLPHDMQNAYYVSQVD